MIVSLRKLRGRLAAARVSSNTGHTAHPPDISSAGALDAARRTQHIRCGHDIMEKLALAGFSGDFLCFADPFVQGPIVRAGSLEAFVRTRAAFIESQKLASNAFDALYESYRDLDRAREYASVNVWLEHDSYDQLVLAKLRDYFSDAKTRPAELRLITVTSYCVDCQKRRSPRSALKNSETHRQSTTGIGTSHCCRSVNAFSAMKRTGCAPTPSSAGSAA